MARQSSEFLGDICRSQVMVSLW